MNIKRAKEEITNTLKAYFTKDELGNYMIPPVRQRPVLLMGPPGIGKTQIMEQIAAENGVGLVAYTITHHTRQSAVGLPFIEKKVFDGVEYSVTEYTMSEILASVYKLMESTGVREGILFLDEINCVSETLAPMMLQFLQCKTFGNQKLPEGWLIVAAGNPPEYNRSVRDFDVVTLDRVKRIDVEEDFAVWKEYAVNKGIHSAVISYLDIKKENFYRIENTADGLEFVTARGWEDLSEVIYAYEKLGLKADRQVCVEYLQMPRIAKDFANYLELYYKYQKSYHVDGIVRGTWERITEKEFAGAPFDEKLSVLGLIYSRLREAAKKTRLQDAFVTALFADLNSFKEDLAGSGDTAELMRGKAAAVQEELKRSVRAGQADKESRDLFQLRINSLEDYAAALSAEAPAGAEEAMDTVRVLFAAERERRSALAKECSEFFDNSFGFLENSVGPSQEMVIFVTEITAGYDSSWFVENFGCEAYFRNNSQLLFDDRRHSILDKIASAEDDSIMEAQSSDE